jgi:hypothetical protein
MDPPLEAPATDFEEVAGGTYSINTAELKVKES